MVLPLASGSEQGRAIGAGPSAGRYRAVLLSQLLNFLESALILLAGDGESAVNDA
jgi:hypothetical protein